MDESQYSAVLLQEIASLLGISVRELTERSGAGSGQPHAQQNAASLNPSLQFLRLIHIYYSLPDQVSKDIAFRLIEDYAKEKLRL